MTDRETPVARVEGLAQRYGATHALDGVTLDIPSGRMVGLIGPDGQFVVQPQFFSLGRFSEGLAPVAVTSSSRYFR